MKTIQTMRRRRVRITAAGRRFQTFLAQDARGGAWRFQTIGDATVDERTLPPVRPSLGMAAAYRRKLDALIAEMQASLVYWLSAKYKANQPEIMALDASPAMELRRYIRKLSRRWQRNFDKAAPELADYFAQSTQDRTDAQLQRILRNGGFSVRFKMSAAQNDAYQAVIGENVGLIKSIAQQHLSAVEGAVMRSVQKGGDLGTLTDTLQQQYGVTRRRAAFIARDQNNKATAVMQRVRQKEIGIKQARWLHSAGGKEPRPTHVAMSGKLYDIDKGMWDEDVKKWIFPGELPNCRCVSNGVVPGFDDD